MKSPSRLPRGVDRTLLVGVGKERLLEAPGRQQQSGKVQLATGGALGTPGVFRRLVQLAGSDDVAEVFTLFMSGPESMGADGIAHPVVGRLVWSLGGAKHMALFDWLMGSRIILAASRLLLEAAHEGAGGDEVQVFAHAAYGAASAGYVRPQRTAYLGAVDAGGTLSVNIPAFSHGVRVAPNPIGTLGGWLVEMITAAGVQIAEYSFPARVFGVGPGMDVTGQGLDLPIPNDARFVRFTNGGQARTAVRFVFSLSL